MTDEIIIITNIEKHRLELISKKMKCSICEQELKPLDGKWDATHQDTNDHVCNPNGSPSLKIIFVCRNIDCIACQAEVHWDNDGEYYGSQLKDWKNFRLDNDIFKDKLLSAIGSFSRKLEVEIYKHDEDKYLPKIKTPLGNFQIKVTYKYKANEEGKILSRKRKLEYLVGKPNDILMQYWIPGISMFTYSIGEHIKEYNNYKRFLKEGNEKGAKFALDLFKSNLVIPAGEKRWWKISSNWLASLYVKIFIKI
jgi:hypothetical protein